MTSSTPNLRDIERLEDGIQKLDTKVDKLGDQMAELRVDTSLLIAKVESDSKLRHDESITSSRRTRLWVSIVGLVAGIAVTIATSAGWFAPKTAEALNRGVEALNQGVEKISKDM